MGARILIVEDTPHSLQLMTYLLQAHGHTAIAADTGERGVELAAAGRPDLVVLDLQLPGIDGYEALAQLRSMPGMAGVPILAVTSFAMVGDSSRALDAGFDDHLTKPIDPYTFADEIDRRLPESLRGSPPVLTSTDAAEISHPLPVRPTGNPRANILVLDDSRINQALLRSVLESHGYQVRVTATVEEAVAAAEDTAPDLVLSDVYVGHQRGTELLSYLRTVPVLAVVPFAFLTDTADWLDPLVMEGKDRVIRRPVDPIVLLDEVDALLKHMGD